NSGNIGLEVALDFFLAHTFEVFRSFENYFIYRLARLVSNSEHIERYVNLQNTLRDAGLLSQDEIDFFMSQVADSVKWLEADGE
ncbi:hypothetical protein Bhyg_05939, partial [Pseudolycoriella hygida]